MHTTDMEKNINYLSIILPVTTFTIFVVLNVYSGGSGIFIVGDHWVATLSSGGGAAHN